MHREKGLFLSVYMDDIKMKGKKDNLKPMWDILMKHVGLGEPTSLLNQLYLECTQRECEPNFKIVKTERLSRIFDLGSRYQTITWLGEIPRRYCRLVAKKCMDRFCELANKKIEQ